jgi:hypothetical protein
VFDGHRGATVVWALAAVLLLVAPTQDDDAWLRERVCGHHSDLRGFAIELPKDICGHRYLHGFSIGLGDEGGADRSITVWAAGNANFFKKSRDIAAAEVAATAPEAVAGVHVLRRIAFVMAGVPAERWRYSFRRKADRAERVVDFVAILRPLRPKPQWSDYYEYSIALHTTPADYEADARQFEAILRGFSFTKPEM